MFNEQLKEVICKDKEVLSNSVPVGFVVEKKFSWWLLSYEFKFDICSDYYDVMITQARKNIDVGYLRRVVSKK